MVGVSLLYRLPLPQMKVRVLTQGVVEYTFNASTCKVEAGKSGGVPGQPVLLTIEFVAQPWAPQDSLSLSICLCICLSL